MNKITTSIAVLALAVTASLGLGQNASLTAGQNPMVGGMAMYANKSIVENAINSADHTTLVAAVKAAGLVDALAGKGPFTVFAPVNSAFEMLPAGTVDTLLKPENKDTLVKILTYHVVPGRWTFDSLSRAIRNGNGNAELKTLSGGTLWAMWNGPRNIVIKDETGATAGITTYDVMQSNGVIQVINRVLMPK